MITADEIIALKPCWLSEAGGLDRIKSLVGDGISATQIAELPDAEVPVRDKRWVLTNLLTRGPRANRKALVRWAASCALDVVHLIKNDEHRDAAECCAQVTIAWTYGEATLEEVGWARSYAADAYTAAAATAAAAAYTAYAACADAAYAAYAAYAADAYAADAAYAAYAAYAADAADAAYAAYAADAAYAALSKQHLLNLAAIIDDAEVEREIAAEVG